MLMEVQDFLSFIPFLSFSFSHALTHKHAVNRQNQLIKHLGGH